MIYCTRKIERGQKTGHNTVTFSSMKNYSKEMLEERLQVNWEPITSCSDTNTAWNNFETVLNYVHTVLLPLNNVI